MSSSRRAYVMSPWGDESSPPTQRRGDEGRPVWVTLPEALGRPRPPADPVGAAGRCLTVGGRTRGELHGWIRTPSGWYGLVVFHIDGVGGTLRTLVPDAALEPRDDQRTMRGSRDQRHAASS